MADGYPSDEMVNVFKGQDAVVLSLSFFGKQRHTALVQASITAGIKRLIASTYGGTDRSEEAEQFFPIAAENGKIIKELRAAENPGWSWTSISCGLFFDLYASVFYSDLSTDIKQLYQDWLLRLGPKGLHCPDLGLWRQQVLCY